MVARKNNSLHPKQAKFLFPVAKAGSFVPPILQRTTKMDAKPKNQKPNWCEPHLLDKNLYIAILKACFRNCKGDKPFSFA